MKSDNPSVKHHYIPAFYLKRWTSSNRKLVEFSRPQHGLIIKNTTPENTGFERRLYEMRGFSPELAQQVEEKFFKPVDTKASEALELLEKFGHTAQWTDESRSAWSRFMISLLLRCPEDIQTFREWWYEDFTSTNDELEEQYRIARNNSHPLTFSEFLEQQPVSVKERYQFEILNSLIDHKGVVSDFNNMHWRVLKITESAPRLLTSDRPVIRTNGLMNKGDHLVLPLSPNLLFIGSYDKDVFSGILRANQIKLAKLINQYIVESAVRFVYSSDELQKRFIHNRFGRTPQPRLIDSIVRMHRDKAVLS